MFGVLLSGLVLLIIGAVIPAFTGTSSTYGSELEDYIVKNNPNNTADVERLTREYDIKSKRTFL